MALYWPYLLADYYSALEWVAVVVASLILVSAIDDLIIDAWFWLRQLYRALTIERIYKPLTPEQLRARDEQPIAIMIPAWHEDDVIAAMVENMMSVLDYRNYVVFVGTYVNDPATIAEVERMRRRYRHLVRVEVPFPGPTCKADCLNWIVKAIFLHESQTGIEFAGVVMHDSEDVLHPIELSFFNYLLPRKDLIQIPVVSLDRDWYDLIAGTYMDDFAEWHAKDLVVRESIAGVVPSAGVGTCFSRRALLTLAAQSNNQPFNTDSLTEDYEIGARLAQLGMKSIFARFPVQFRVSRASRFGFGPTREITVTMPLCVREYFPSNLRAAYRQRARWILGIGLQSWSHLGWKGTLAYKYLLFRDRKGIVTSYVNILGYVLAIHFIGFELAAYSGIWTTYYLPLFESNGLLIWLLSINGVALLLRVVQRVYFVARLYGWEHGVLSVPRMVIGNFVNFLAACRAWRIYIVHLATGAPIAWDKTMHDFPSDAVLISGRQRARLGDILLAWQAIDQTKLSIIVEKQKAEQSPFGRILIRQGWLDEETLAEAIAFQSGLDRAEVHAGMVRLYANAIPIAMAVRHRALVIGRAADGRYDIAVARPLPRPALSELSAALQAPLTQRLVRENEIAAGLRLLRGDETSFDVTARGGGAPLLGDILIEQNLVAKSDFEAALEDYHPERDGRIGEFLVKRGIVTPAAIQQAVAEQQRAMTSQMTSQLS
jgi:adsorption protein B